MEAKTLFPLGALFVLSFLSLIKGEITYRHTLSCSNSLSFKQRLHGALVMLLAEASLFSLLCFLGAFASYWSFTTAKIAILLSVALYIVFSFSLVAFGRFPRSEEIYSLSRSPEVFVRYLPKRRMVAIILLWSISLIWISIPPIYAYLILAVSLLLSTAFKGEYFHLQNYGVRLISRKRKETSTHVFVPSKQCISKLFLEKRPNVVTVIVESLSAVDSFATSGIENNLPLLDEFLGKEGKIYRNFFSPTRGSWHGIAFLFGGYYAMSSSPFPGGSAIKNSFPSELKKELGYSTYFLSGSNLCFGNEFELYKSLGFENILGSYQIDLSRSKIRGVFDSVPDQILYSFAEEQIKSLRGPFLYSIYTTDPHYGISLDKIDNELTQFLSILKRLIPKNTLVLVVGDHRKHGAPRPQEEEHFGWYGSRHRAFLGAFGDGVTKGLIDDRLISSFDLMWSLDEILFGKNLVTSFVPLQPSRRALLDPERKRWVVTTDGIQFEPARFIPPVL